MNLLPVLTTILATARKHPWLLVLLILALIAHGADLQWTQLHKFFSTVAYGLFSIAFLYAGGTSLPGASTLPPQSDQNAKQPNDKV